MCAIALEPVIATERLLLRPPVLSDAVWIAELANDADVARMTTAVRYPYGLADAELYLERVRAMGGARAQAFLIEHSMLGPIGMLGLYRKGQTCPELGFWLGRVFRNRGFATEALIGVVRWAEDDWNCRGLLASHFVDNPASARVLDKAGFLYTGAVERRFSLGRGRAVETRMMVWLA